MFLQPQIEFDKAELNTIINKVKENVFIEALGKGASTEKTVRKVQEAVEQFTWQVATEKTKVDATAETVEITERMLREEVKSEIGEEEILKLTEGKSISEESKAKVVKSLNKSIKKLEKQRAELNLKAPSNRNEVQQASLQTQSELIEEKIHQYSILNELLSRDNEVGLRRSSSLDNLLEDTYIRQGQMAFGTVAGAFMSLAHEANTLSRHDYVELQRTRLPEEAKNNPEVLAKLSTGYILYKGVAKVREGISALDDATGNVVSGAMNKIGEGFEWLGTHTRRYVRDDFGFSQRVAQNTGDVAKLTAEIFAPGAIAKGVNMTGKTISAIRTTLQARFSRNIYARFNQIPYDARNAQSLASELLGSSNFTRTTVPGQSMPNVRLAGQCKERVITNPITKEAIVQRVVFDRRGFPIFEPYVKVETRISGDLASMSREAHMRAVTRQLREDILLGKVARNKFTDSEWTQIKGGRERIGEYTWHHHQETGRMQLVPTDIHEWIRHVGGG